MKKKKVIYLILSVIITIILISIISLIVVFNNNGVAQLEAFEKAMDEKDYDTLSHKLSTASLSVSKEETKAFVTYMYKTNNIRKFQKEMSQIKQNIKDDKTKNSIYGTITDNQNNTIIEVKQNGSHMLILDKISFKPYSYNVYLKPQDTSMTYLFKDFDGKEQTVVTDPKSYTKFGRFFVGEYNLSAIKRYESPSLVKGQQEARINIKTDLRNAKNKVVATENFKESSFQVILDNDEQLKDLKIYVNGVQTKYDENRIYGPYPSNRSISVHAEGKYKGKTLKSNTVKVKENKDINHQKITMKFDTTKIDEMIKKDRRIENEAKAFMNDYTKDLNKAYKEVDYKHVEKYFESNSSLSNHIKSMVDSKNKSKYTMPIYTSYKKDGSKIYIELIKKDKSNNTIKSQYELAYNRKDKSFKIVSYGDV